MDLAWQQRPLTSGAAGAGPDKVSGCLDDRRVRLEPGPNRITRGKARSQTIDDAVPPRQP